MSVTAQTEDLKKFIRNSVSKQGDSNLEEHLQKLFQFFILHNPSSALQNLEEVSYLIKHGGRLD